MLYLALGQGWIFLILFFIGANLALICIGVKVLFKYFLGQKNRLKNKEKIEKNKKKIGIEFIEIKQKSVKNAKKSAKKWQILKNLADFGYFIEIICLSIILFFIIFLIDYGAVRFYHILAFFGGFYLIRFFVNKFIVRRNFMVYSGVEARRNGKD